MLLNRAVVLLATFLLAASVTQGSAQITCYTEPSVAGEFNCQATTSNFNAATIEECCVDRNGFFFEGGDDESCQACIVFGFFSGSEISLPEQGETTILAIGFIKGGNVQQLTGIDRRNTARFGITITGSAIEGPDVSAPFSLTTFVRIDGVALEPAKDFILTSEGPNADFTIQQTSFEIEGPDAREPFGLTTFIRIDGVALEPAEDFTLTLEGRNAAGRAIIDPTLPGQFIFPTLRVAIEDVENATLQFTESDYPNPEGELFIVPVVQLLTGIATDLTVRIIPLNITEALTRELPSAFPTIPPFDPRVPNIATSVADFSTTPQEITFVAGGATTIPLNPGIAIVDDEINEVEQLFALFLEVVTAIDPARVDLTSERFATLGRIFDDDPINVGFEQERYTVVEAIDATGQLIPIPIIKENDQESEITFEVIATLTLGSGPTAAQPGEDFEANPPVQRQPFQPDEQEIDYRYELFDDTPANPDVPEPTETFQIQLSLADEGLTNINLGASGGSLFATATVVIIDDDDVIIVWERNVTCVNESQSILELCVRVLNLDTVQFPEGFEVSLAANTIRGTAADPGDYTALVADSDIFIDIIDDDTRRTCIEVVIINDTLQEITESFSIEVVPDPFVANFPSNVRLDPALTFMKILDNDFVRIGFNQTEYGPAVEGTDNVATVYVAVLEGDLQRSVTVTFSTASGTATADADVDSVTRELTFDIDTKVIAVEIPINDDSCFEQFLETFTVSLTRDPADPVNEVILNPDVATVSIQDDEVVVIGYAPVLYTVEEDDSTGEVDVTIRLLQGDLTGLTASTAIPIDVSAASFTATAGSDFNFAPRTLQFDELNTVFTLTVSIIDDVVTEGPEVFFMLAESSDVRVQISPERANVTIIDDDPTVIGFVNAPVSVVESAGPAILQVALISGSLEREVFVDFVTQDGTAVAPGDYTTTTQRLTFGPSSVVGVPINVPVDITSDEVLEDDESFGASLTLVNTPLIVAVVPAVTTVTIEDDDEAQIGFVPDSYTVNEEDGSVTLTVRVISGSLAREVEVGFMTENDEALAGEDYSAVSETLTFSPTVIEQTVTVPILSDNFFEFRERFFGNLTLLSTDANVIVSPSRADVFIDDDDVVRIGFNQTEYGPVLEGTDNVATVYVAVLEGNLQRRVSVTFSTTVLGTATADADYDLLTRQLTFDINTKVIPVEITINNDDFFKEFLETFTVSLTHDPADPANEVILNPDEATVSIQDDDELRIGFNPDTYTVNEDVGTVNLIVEVLQGQPGPRTAVSVDYQLLDATAVVGSDYVRSFGQLMFTNTDLSRSIPVQIIDDGTVELDEVFLGNLFSGSVDARFTLSPENATITILHEGNPGPVSNVIWDPQSDSNVKVSWSAPLKPNGIVLEYHVVLINYIGGGLIASQNVAGSTFMIEFNSEELEAGVPYSFSIVAINKAGNGEHTTITNFTRELSPPAPSGVMVDRSIGTQMTISWTPLTLVEARSLIQFYRVFYNPGSSNSKRQSITTCFQSPCNVPGSERSVLIIGLDPSSSYSVMVVAVNGHDQEGEFSETIITQATTSSGNVTVIVVGVVAVVVVLLIIIGVIAIVALVLRYRKRQDVLSVGKHESIQLREVATLEDPDIRIKDNVAYSAVHRYHPRGNLPNPPTAIYQYAEDIALQEHAYDVIPEETQATVNRLHKASLCEVTKASECIGDSDKPEADYEVVEPEGNP